MQIFKLSPRETQALVPKIRMHPLKLVVVAGIELQISANKSYYLEIRISF